jgi:hypothetical protein
MARCLLAGKAVAGIVTAVDREHREVVTTNRARVGGQPDPCGAAGVGGAADANEQGLPRVRALVIAVLDDQTAGGRTPDVIDFLIQRRQRSARGRPGSGGPRCGPGRCSSRLLFLVCTDRAATVIVPVTSPAADTVPPGDLGEDALDREEPPDAPVLQPDLGSRDLVIWFNWQIGAPVKRSLIAYDH